MILQFVVAKVAVHLFPYFEKEMTHWKRHSTDKHKIKVCHTHCDALLYLHLKVDIPAFPTKTVTTAETTEYIYGFSTTAYITSVHTSWRLGL